MKKRLFLFTIKTIVIAFLLWAVMSTSIENVDIRTQIKEFMKKGVYNEDISYDDLKYYVVPRETWQEDIDSFTVVNGKKYPGSSGDMLVGLRSAIKDIPLIDPFITYFFGGHASLCAYEYDDHENTILKSDCIETAGMNEHYEDNVVSSSDRQFWMNNEYRNSVIGLRVHSSEEQRKIAVNHAISLFGDFYNYSFIFNTKNTHYCSDIMSKAWLRAGINLNHDLVATTVLDLIVAPETYLFMYKYVDSQNVTHIYYIDDL